MITDFEDEELGVFAGDEAVYRLFAIFFTPIARAYHFSSPAASLTDSPNPG